MSTDFAPTLRKNYEAFAGKEKYLAVNLYFRSMCKHIYNIFICSSVAVAQW
jgi:hypothetical protein